MNLNREQCAIVVPSCDNYSDLWPPLFASLRMFWPDCPFTVYLISNHAACNVSGIENVIVGDDVSWSDNLVQMVRGLRNKFILLYLDDLFLQDCVNTERIISAVDWMDKSGANYLRLVPSQKPDKKHDETYGVVSSGTIYRTSTLFPLWRREVLTELLKPGESAWDFEIEGSVRSDKYDGFFSTRDAYFDYMNGVIKGRWRRRAVRRLSALGFTVDLTRRQMMTLSAECVFSLGAVRSNALNMFPARYRRGIRRWALGSHREKERNT